MTGHSHDVHAVRQRRQQPAFHEQERGLGDLGRPQRLVTTAERVFQVETVSGGGVEQAPRGSAGQQSACHSRRLAALSRKTEGGAHEAALLSDDDFAAAVLTAVGTHPMRQARLPALRTRRQRGQ